MANYLKIDYNQLISLGEYIRVNRLKRGLGLREMAGKLDISSAYLSNLEMGKHSKANPLLLLKIAEILEIDHLKLYKTIGYTDKDLDDIEAEMKQKPNEDKKNKKINKMVQYMSNFSLEEFDLLERYFKLLKNSKTPEKNQNNRPNSGH